MKNYMQEFAAIPSIKQQNVSIQELKSFFIEAPAAIAILNGAGHRYTFVNPNFEQLFDRSADKLIGKSVKETSPDLEGQGIHELFDKVYETGEPFSANDFPATFNKNGVKKTSYYNFIIYPIKNPAGHVTDLLVHAHEVTRKMTIRKRIEESEERFRTLATEFPVFVWLTDEKLQTTFLNRTGLEYFNIDGTGKIAELSWKKFIHPGDLTRVLEVMNAAIKKHEPYTLKMRLKNGLTGEYRWFLDNGMPQYSNESFTGFIGTSMDIHEQQLADEMIHQSEEKYKQLSATLEEKVNQRTAELVDTQNFLQQLIDASVEFICVVDKDLRFITVNKKFEETTGLDRKNINGKHLFEITPKAKGTIQEDSILKALLGEAVYLDKRPAIARPEYFVDTYFLPLVLKGQVEGVIIMSRDVTEIVKSELILAQKNRELMEAQQIAQLGSWDWNMTTNEISWSDQMYQIYGYGDERFPVSFEKAIERMFPDDAKKTRKRMKDAGDEAQRLFREKGQTEFNNRPVEYPILLPDGSKKILRGVGKIMLTNDGKISRVIGTVQDVTEQKKSEEKISLINRKLNEAQQIAGLGSWEWNVLTNELSWSANLYGIYGLDPDEAISYEKFISLIHPDDRKDVEKIIDSSYKSKRFREFYHRIVTPAGTVKTLHARGEVILNDRDIVWKMIGTGQDVTVEKNTEEKLIETNEQLEQRNRFVEKLINSSLDLIMVVDKELKFITVNKKAESVIRLFYPHALPGKKITEVNPQIKNSEALDDLMKAFEGEIVIRDKVKSTISENYYEHNYVPLLNASDEVYAVMIISHDITQNIAQREELRKLNESDKLKSDFITMASHELKTPVTSIKGYTQLLLSALKKEEANEEKTLSPLLVKSSLISIDKQVTRLTRLMSELLDLSKIETGMLVLNNELFNLNELVIETVQDVLYTNSKHSISVFHDFGCSVLGDKDRVGQVLINFLTNAIKYSPNSDKIEVWIQRSKKNYVSVSVKDYGIGIDKKYHEKIFERFYRAEGKEEQTYPGFGIGLFIAKEIIQRHNGSICVTSEKGKGSVFTFDLPVARHKE